MFYRDEILDSAFDDLEGEGEVLHLNKCRCEECGHEWSDIWNGAPDDDCPKCGSRHIDPYGTQELTGDVLLRLQCHCWHYRCRHEWLEIGTAIRAEQCTACELPGIEFSPWKVELLDDAEKDIAASASGVL